MNDLYTERILDYWQKAQENQKHPSIITHSANEISPVCGDDVYCEARIENGLLTEIGMFPRGCCICDACCAIAAEYFLGRPIVSIKSYTEEDWMMIIGVPIPENRRYCASMGWRTLKALKPHIPRKLI